MLLRKLSKLTSKETINFRKIKKLRSKPITVYDFIQLKTAFR